MYYAIVIGLSILFVAFRFAVYTGQRKGLGKKLIDLSSLNISTRRSYQQVIMIIGFFYITYYYYKKLYVQMNISAIAVIIISCFYISLGVFNIFKKSESVGIYENGIVTTQGIGSFKDIDSFQIRKVDRQFSLCEFYPKRKFLRSEQFIIDGNMRYKVQKAINRYSSCQYKA